MHPAGVKGQEAAARLNTRVPAHLPDQAVQAGEKGWAGSTRGCTLGKHVLYNSKVPCSLCRPSPCLCSSLEPCTTLLVVLACWQARVGVQQALPGPLHFHAGNLANLDLNEDL